MNSKLLIFDCDGTLVDSEGIANRTFIKSINDLGIPLTEEEAWDHFPGTSLALCIQYVETKFKVKLPTDFVPTQRAIQEAIFARELQPISGAPHVLNELSSFSKCVASNGPHQMVIDNLTTTGLIHHFGERTFSAYQINKWKPSPDLFLHAAKSLGFEPEDCIVIEDSMAGMQAGINAKMHVMAYIPKNQHYVIDDIGGVQKFETMSQLPDLINSL